MSKFQVYATLLVALAASAFAPAHAVDTAAVVTALTGTGTDMATVGAAIVGVLIVLITFSWVFKIMKRG